MVQSQAQSEEEVQILLAQALYQQAVGLTQTALDTVARIKSTAGMDPTDLKSLAAVQYQGSDYSAVLRSLEGQDDDIVALLLRGKAEFGLGQFANAATFFQKAKDRVSKVDSSLRPELQRQCTIWWNKSQLEIGQTRSFGDINQGAYLNTTLSQNPTMFTPQQPSAAASSAAPPKKQATATPQAAAAQSSGPSVLNLKYDWYQNATHVFVAYKIKTGGDALAAPGNLKVNFTDNSCVLENSQNDEILAGLDFSNSIDPSNCSYSCTAKRIDLKIKKEIENQNWVALEAGTSGTTATPAVATSGPVPAYPSSSKNKKNWDALDKEIEKEIANDKPEGDQALNGLFKQIYERSDEATRRAMIKSYQTSGGTVLSTNWGEVADKDYEGKDRPDAPDGQKWVKDK